MNRNYCIFMFLILFGFVKNLISMEFTREKPYKYSNIRVFVKNNTPYAIRVEYKASEEWKLITTDLNSGEAINITGYLKLGSKFDENMQFKFYFSPDNPTTPVAARAIVQYLKPLIITPFSQEIANELEKGYKEVVIPIEYNFVKEGLHVGKIIYLTQGSFQEIPITEETEILKKEQPKKEEQGFLSEIEKDITPAFFGPSVEKNLGDLHESFKLADETYISYQEANEIVRRINSFINSDDVEVGVYPYSVRGYYYLSVMEKDFKHGQEEVEPYFTGEIKNAYLSKLKMAKYSNLPPEKKEEKINKIKKALVGNYKIHLMPKSLSDLVTVLKLLIKRAIEDPNLRKIINTIKFYKESNFTSIENLRKSLENRGQIFPLVVIYPATGQENAKYLLDTLIELYRGIEGANITPRYNQQVNSLIYYAQGDGDDKTDNNKEYFGPNRIFYKSDFEGEEKDYRLL